MAYLHPIEAVANRISEIPSSDGNFIIDIENSSVFFDTKIGTRIHLTDVITFMTENDRTNYTEPVEGKIYVVFGTGTIYTYYGGEWISLTSKTIISHDTFYLSSSKGNESNSGLTPFDPIDTFEHLMNLYPDSDIYNIYIVEGDYNYDIEINNKHKVHFNTVITSGIVKVFGNIKISGVQDLHIENITCNNIIINRSNGDLYNMDIHVTDENTDGLSVTSSIITISESGINDSTLAAFHANESSTLTIKSCGGSNNAIVYKAENGSTINIIDGGTTGTIDTEISNVSRVYKDTDKTDIKTQEYIAETLSIQEV